MLRILLGANERDHELFILNHSVFGFAVFRFFTGNVVGCSRVFGLYNLPEALS
jgi:hypothetical protein